MLQCGPSVSAFRHPFASMLSLSHIHTGIDFWSRELTTLPHEDERGAFSEEGDSGAVIADHGGRIVAVLTAGGGSTNSTDVTFATPFCKLEKRIKDAFPGARLLDTLE
jgi:hypothetical protein